MLPCSLQDPQETGKCKCQGLFLVGNSSLIMNSWTSGRKRKHYLSPKLKSYIFIKDLMYLSQVEWSDCKSHWVIPHNLQLDREIGRSKRRNNFKVTCSCFSNRKYPFPVATYPNEQAQGSSDICIGQTWLDSVLFQPTFLKLPAVNTSYHPRRLLHPFRGDKAAGESNFIKIK